MRIAFAVCVACAAAWSGWAADPVVSNVRASQRPGTKLVDIYYDLSDADGGSLTVSVAVSTNSGVSYDLPATHFTGDVGSGVSAGAGRHIVWDAGADWGGKYSVSMRVKVTADDGQPSLPDAPSALSASDGVYTDKVAVTWSASAGALGYIVYRGANANTNTAGQIGFSAVLTYNDTEVTANVTNYYWARATNAFGVSGFSPSDTGWRSAESSPYPPDPSEVATEPEPGVVTLIGQSTAFLYTGTNPIQTGVAAGTISTTRVAVLRGSVLSLET